MKNTTLVYMNQFAKFHGLINKGLGLKSAKKLDIGKIPGSDPTGCTSWLSNTTSFQVFCQSLNQRY